jgi:hypothetical protein
MMAEFIDGANKKSKDNQASLEASDPEPAQPLGDISF